MPQILRLAGERNFRQVYRRGRRARGQGLGFNYLRMPSSPSRVAVVVSRQVSKLATKRNLYKRRLWASLRHLSSPLPPQGYYLIIIAQPQIKDLSYQELRAELEKLILRLD